MVTQKMMRTGLATMLFALVGSERPVRTQSGTIYVTTTVQAINGTDGECSLQEAIYAANFNSSHAVDSVNPDGSPHLITTECGAGVSDADVIVLPERAVFQMNRVVDELVNGVGPTATPSIRSTITIEAHGSLLQWTGSVNARAFTVIAGNLTIRNAHIKGYTAKGGNGKGGGGGGLGAGGAIYVKGGSLTIDSSTFEANGAAGGNGSSIFGGAGGGGGGMGGNGGLPEDGVFADAGGGGGSRGNGGDAGANYAGGGGGTVTSGTTRYAGLICGGEGGQGGGIIGSPVHGHDAPCDGGGGGGGGTTFGGILGLSGNGGKGAYGGGGGGGGYAGGNGGQGGFGGGGGGGTYFPGTTGSSGGDAGFGGGGGAGQGGVFFGGPGHGGAFGGNAGEQHGAGGAGLGGAIFSHDAEVRIYNSTFSWNFAVRGVGAGPGAQNGRDAGAAIFAVNSSLYVFHSTISGNETTGDGGGIVLYKSGDGSVVLEIRNTIIANNMVGTIEAPRQCFYTGDTDAVQALGSRNIIENNFGCPGMISGDDPQLGPLQLNDPGLTPTMAPSPFSPAINLADPTYALPTDQRGVARPQGGGYDIGAYEGVPDFDLSVVFTPVVIPLGGSGTATAVVTSQYGFNSLVKLRPLVVPDGLTVTFSPSEVTPPANDGISSTVQITADAAVTAGTYTIVVSGDAGGALQHNVTFEVNVQASIATVTEVFRTLIADNCVDNTGVADALLTTLSLAAKLQETGRTEASNSTLLALLNQVNSQAGKHILSSCVVGGRVVVPADVMSAGIQSLLQQQ